MKIGSIARGTAGTAIGMFVAVWLGVVVLPALLPTAGAAALTAAGVLSIVAGALTVRSLRPKSDEQRLSWNVWWTALVAPAAGTGLLLVDWVRGGVAPRWVLDGDMVWNTAQSLFIHADSGVQPAVHPNPAPLTNLLFAMSYGPVTEPSLALVLGAHAVVIIMLTAASSFVSGLYIARRGAGLHPFVRACLVVAVSWLPYTGGLLGGLIAFGHANALTSYLALWSAWVIFSDPFMRYLYKAIILLTLATVVASSWAPLAVVPVALALLAAFFEWREWRRGGEGSALKDFVLAVLALAQFVAYGLFVTLPDLRRDSGGLSANGAVTMVGPYFMLGIVLLVILTAVITGFCRGANEQFRENREIALGVVLVLVLSLPVLAYMLLQRVGLPSMWGYYPVKFISLLIAVLAGVLIGSIADMISPRLGWVKQVLCAATAVPLFLSVLAPAYLSGQGWGAFAPSLVRSVAAPVELDARSTKDLIRIFDEHPFAAQVTVAVAQDSGWERLMNNYLIQLSAERSSEEIRLYAYTLDTMNAQQMCDMIVLWSEEVRVRAPSERVALLEDQLRDCEGSPLFSVEPALLQ